MSVRNCMALEADRNHIAVAGLEAEGARHLHVPVENSMLLAGLGDKKSILHHKTVLN